MIAWSGLMLIVLTRSYPFQHEFHHDVDSPGIALQISRDSADIDAVLHRSDQEDSIKAIHGLRLNNRLDLVFIPIYGFFLWSFGRVFSARTKLLTLLVLGTALFDYVEDWYIFSALDGENPATYIPSLTKWALLALALLATGVILLRSTSEVYSLATKRLMGIGYLISSLLLLIAVVLGEFFGYSLIEVGALLYGELTALQAIGLLTWKPEEAVPIAALTEVVK
jgi:hypothetical protein